MGKMYTLEDYEKTKVEYASWVKKWDNYSGNNPDKYQADIRAAARELRRIEQYLKDAGLLERTEKEKLERELDRMFPDAQSKEVVEYNGKEYQRRYWPLEKSRSGKTVNKWGRSWEPIQED